MTPRRLRVLGPSISGNLMARVGRYCPAWWKICHDGACRVGNGLYFGHATHSPPVAVVQLLNDRLERTSPRSSLLFLVSMLEPLPCSRPWFGLWPIGNGYLNALLVFTPYPAPPLLSIRHSFLFVLIFSLPRLVPVWHWRRWSPPRACHLTCFVIVMTLPPPFVPRLFFDLIFLTILFLPHLDFRSHSQNTLILLCIWILLGII